jgi:hypothetical protein
MSMPPPEHLRVRDRMPGTVWRAFRPFLILLLVVAITYTMFSVGVALATNDKCGGEHFETQKTWNWFPPQWECTVTVKN